MFVSYDTLSDTARVWIYQADKKLSAEEIAIIRETLEKFTADWAAHGAPLKSSFKILHDQFLILAVEESYNQASGCSIDSSVHVIQKLSNELGVDFFNRTKVAFVINDEVYLESLNELKEKVKEGLIKKDTLTFNNLVKSKKELEASWMVPAGQTWIDRYFD